MDTTFKLCFKRTEWVIMHEKIIVRNSEVPNNAGVVGSDLSNESLLIYEIFSGIRDPPVIRYCEFDHSESHS
jgi:hypothetical protein